MKKTANILLALLLTLYYSCDDVFEEDIENDLVQIVSPNEGDTIEGNTVEFNWQALDGADDYRVQVINDNQLTVLDSLVSTTNLSVNINAGNYQWRIKGENFAYSTQYTFPVNFSVVDSEDLTNQNVDLLTPSENFYTNSTNIILTWSSIATADSYSLEILKNDSGQQTVLQETNITTTSFNVPSSTFDEDAEYIWKIKAVNSMSESAFSERMIFLDTSIPSQASLVSPTNSETLTDTTVDFNWLLGSDTGSIQSARKSRIEVSMDINFSTQVFSEEDLETNSYQYTFSDTGTYYWKVRISDDAGNVGDYSAVSSFTIE